MTDNRKVEARKPWIFQEPMFGCGLQKATVRQMLSCPLGAPRSMKMG